MNRYSRKVLRQHPLTEGIDLAEPDGLHTQPASGQREPADPAAQVEVRRHLRRHQFVAERHQVSVVVIREITPQGGRERVTDP